MEKQAIFACAESSACKYATYFDFHAYRFQSICYKIISGTNLLPGQDYLKEGI